MGGGTRSLQHGHLTRNGALSKAVNPHTCSGGPNIDLCKAEHVDKSRVQRAGSGLTHARHG